MRTFFFFNDTATTEIYTLSLHDALPIALPRARPRPRRGVPLVGVAPGDASGAPGTRPQPARRVGGGDRGRRGVGSRGLGACAGAGPACGTSGTCGAISSAT